MYAYTRHVCKAGGLQAAMCIKKGTSCMHTHIMYAHTSHACIHTSCMHTHVMCAQGWGPAGGHVYQKGHVEFFASPESFKALLPKLQVGWVAYAAVCVPLSCVCVYVCVCVCV